MKTKKQIKALSRKLDLVAAATVKLMEEKDAMKESLNILQAIVVDVGKAAGLDKFEFLSIVNDAIGIVKEFEGVSTEELAAKAQELLAEAEREANNVH